MRYPVECHLLRTLPLHRKSIHTLCTATFSFGARNPKSLKRRKLLRGSRKSNAECYWLRAYFETNISALEAFAPGSR
jgi:hypothetical protein